MLTAHRIALKPNNKQATYFAKATGTARFAYNWALSEWQSQYDAWKQDNSRPKLTEASLRRLLNKIKRDRFSWMTEVTKNAPQMAIIHLGVAFRNFFSGRARYPKFRKKGIHDRDVNAAINLRNLAVSSTVSACGEEGSGTDRKVCVKPASGKQEIGFAHL